MRPLVPIGLGYPGSVATCQIVSSPAQILSHHEEDAARLSEGQPEKVPLIRFAALPSL